MENDIENLEQMGVKVIAADLLRMSGEPGAGKNPPRLGADRRDHLELARQGHKRKLKRNEPTVVILAAGLGTRMRSKRAKVLHRAGGLALVEQVVEAARTLAPTDESSW